MQAVGTTVIVLLSVALLLAIGLLAYGVGKFVYGIAHYYLRERKPERRFRHPHWGVFTSEGDLWSCQLRRDGGELLLVVGGSEDAPSQRLLAQAQDILSRLAALEQRAVEFLRRREKEIGNATLELDSLDITDDQHPNDFALEFVDPRDDSGVWRVEFVDGEPTYVGFDD